MTVFKAFVSFVGYFWPSVSDVIVLKRQELLFELFIYLFLVWTWMWKPFHWGGSLIRRKDKQIS